eukprot:CAMPEP_0197037000 /NCGR_PEP_ID=MMETSP1384-20130603/14321_1 /TAXON_ID=29189 /ORGANISM="Ammonia sp." /LENGTH=782 /DNA_ID=CAMNT_0042467243 /DNA_START=59 /DNA_END=2407 /DNA_ORIENTATION=+
MNPLGTYQAANTTAIRSTATSLNSGNQPRRLMHESYGSSLQQGMVHEREHDAFAQQVNHGITGRRDLNTSKRTTSSDLYNQTQCGVPNGVYSTAFPAAPNQLKLNEQSVLLSTTKDLNANGSACVTVIPNVYIAGNNKHASSSHTNTIAYPCQFAQPPVQPQPPQPQQVKVPPQAYQCQFTATTPQYAQYLQQPSTTQYINIVPPAPVAPLLSYQLNVNVNVNTNLQVHQQQPPQSQYPYPYHYQASNANTNANTTTSNLNDYRRVPISVLYAQSNTHCLTNGHFTVAQKPYCSNTDDDDCDTDGGDSDHELSAQCSHPSFMSVSPRFVPRFQSGSIIYHKYKLLSKLGQGTFGEVWTVQPHEERYSHLGHKKVFAAKLITEMEKLGVEERRKRELEFLSEAYILQKLNATGSRHIIQLVEVLNDELVGPAMVMESAKCNLKQYILQHVKIGMKISLHVIRCIAAQMLSAMTFIHGEGHMVHSDMKTENVLVFNCENVGDEPTIKICDFGNTINIGSRYKSFNISTLNYRAPELFFGNKDHISAQLDVWSIGCILFELVYHGALSMNTHSLDSHQHYREMLLFETAPQCPDYDIVHKIWQIFGKFPRICYNEIYSVYFNKYCDTSSFLFDNEHTRYSTSPISYKALKNERKRRILCRLKEIGVDQYYEPRAVGQFNKFDAFLDLLACLLDPNPLTRYNAWDALKHSFIIQDHHKLIGKMVNCKHEFLSTWTDDQRDVLLTIQTQIYQQDAQNLFVGGACSYSSSIQNEQDSHHFVVKRELVV